MGSLIRSFNWSKTALGSPETWPQPLRIAVRIMLDCPFGMYIAWGNDYVQLYNDGYRPILGATKHPQALGLGTRTTFAEIWPTIGPMFEGVMQGIPVGFPDFELQLDRNGFLEECVFDFSYSPIRLEDGEVGGVLVTVIETTEKVRAAKALKESEQDLLFAIEATELGTWDLNPATNKFRGNSRLKEWFGLKPDEEIELPVALAVIADKDRQRVTAAIQTAMEPASGGHYDIIYTIIHAQTKSERIVRAKGQAVFTAEGIPFRFNGTLQDVTKETVAHQLLIEGENRLANERMVLYRSFMHAPAGIAIYKGDTHIYEFANLQHEETARRKITIGKTVEALFPELEHQGLIAMLRNVFLTGEPFIANELPINLSSEEDDQLVLGYYNLVVQPLMDDKGNTERILSHAVEVTDQVKAKQQIEESERRFAAAVEAIQGILWTNNAKGEMEGEQKGWTALTGQSYEEYQGYGWAKAVHPDDAQPTIDAWNEAVKESKTFVFEHRIKTKSNEWELFSIKAIPLLSHDGSVTEWVGVHTNITEQKRNEEKLMYSKALLEAHNEANRDGLMLVDAKGKIISYNQSFVDVWRMPKDIVESKDDERALTFAMSQLVNPQQFIEKVKWLYNNPSESSIDELEYLDGRIVERHGNCVLGEDGIYYAWSWTFRDITAQKAAAVTIIESEKQFRTFADSIQSLAWIADSEGWINWYNQRWYDYTGSTFEEMQGWGWEKVHHPDHVKNVVDFVKEAWKKDSAWELIFPLRKFDGEYRWFVTHAYPVKDANGNIDRWIGTNTDITQQKTFTVELEKQVKERTAELNLKNKTFEAAERIAKFGSYTWNLKSGVMGYSDNLFRLLDCEPQEFEPSMEKLLSFIHPDDLQQVIKNGEDTMQTGMLVETPYRIVSKAGNIKQLRSSGSMIGDDDNRMLIGTVQDISKDVEAAEELRTKNIELELSNAELSSFSYVASHDLQEPLRKIQAFSKLILQNQTFDDKTQDYFNRIIAAGERMQNLIVSLLDFSRTSETDLIFEPCNLNTIVEECKDNLQITIHEKKALIEYNNLPTIKASQIQFSQLFSNLIDNAIKYSRPQINPHIKITASIAKGKDIDHPLANNQKNYHQVKIEDNGIGFEKEYETKIFELFQRLHSRSEYSGTGIGLAIVKRIITNHNGFIVAEGRPGIGSTFIIYIPTV